MGTSLDELAARRPQVELEPPLEALDAAAFAADGFTGVARITTDAELAWLGEVYDLLFSERTAAVPGGYFDLARPYESAGPDLLPQILFPEARVPALRQTAYWRNARALAARLLGAEPALLHGWGHMIRKPAHVGAALPWHQDEAYWDPAFDYAALGCWMPLDPATPESGCLRFIPGSQRGPVRAHHHVGDDPAVHALETHDVDASRAVDVPLAPGGASFHHCRTLHGSGPNQSARVRRAFAIEWQLAPVRRAAPASRPWVDEGKRAWEARRPRT